MSSRESLAYGRLSGDCTYDMADDCILFEMDMTSWFVGVVVVHQGVEILILCERTWRQQVGRGGAAKKSLRPVEAASGNPRVVPSSARPKTKSSQSYLPTVFYLRFCSLMLHVCCSVSNDRGGLYSVQGTLIFIGHPGLCLIRLRLHLPGSAEDMSSVFSIVQNLAEAC